MSLATDELAVDLSPDQFRGVCRQPGYNFLYPRDKANFRTVRASETSNGKLTGRWLVAAVESVTDVDHSPDYRRVTLAWPPIASADVPEER